MKAAFKLIPPLVISTIVFGCQSLTLTISPPNNLGEITVSKFTACAKVTGLYLDEAENIWLNCQNRGIERQCMTVVQGIGYDCQQVAVIQDALIFSGPHENVKSRDYYSETGTLREKIGMTKIPIESCGSYGFCADLDDHGYTNLLIHTDNEEYARLTFTDKSKSKSYDSQRKQMAEKSHF